MRREYGEQDPTNRTPPSPEGVSAEGATPTDESGSGNPQESEPGQDPVEIEVDALPGLTLRGQVQDVADFYDGTRHWLSGGVKEYETVIMIDQVSETGLKPGMSSKVKILVGELSDCLVVPVPAVVEKDGQHYCYILDDQGAHRRPVTIGASTESLVEIRDGLTEGEKVALDARRRWQSELESGGSDGDATSEVATSVADVR